MAYVGWNSVANQVNTTTGAALNVNGQVTSSLPIGAGMGGEGATNLILAPSLNLNFALFGQETLDPRINFLRTTNATLTNSAGLIAYAPMNLLTYSEQFDNAAWSKASGTVTANVGTAPDGTITADQISSTGGGVFRTSIAVTQGLLHTASVYAKAISGTGVFLFGFDANPTGGRARFNLLTGEVTNLGVNVVSAKTTSLADGWYRCEISAITTSTTCNIIYYSTASGTNWLVWGAQLEVGPTATTYNSTTVKNLLGFTQEFDNAAWTKSNSFVQTNLLLRSEEFENASWSTAGATITTNDIVSPNGYQNAEALIENTVTNAFHFSQQTITKAAISTQYAFSIYVKAKGRQIGISVASASGGAVCRFNPETGLFTLNAAAYGTWTAQSTTATLVGNGWYRVVLVGTSDTETSATIQVSTYNTALATNVYTGDGVSGFYIWGAQFVQGAVAGDYVRTSSTVMPVMYQAPTGTLSADKIVPNTVSGDHLVAQGTIAATSGTVYCLSVYAKAAGYNFIRLSFGNVAGGGYTFFNLSNGTIGATGSMLSNQIQDVGNGWYRCTVFRAAGSTASLGGDIYITSTNNQFTWTGDGTSGVFVWGAQLSDSASLDPYVYNPVAAPTAQAYYGPRFDYDPITLQPKGLLIEEQRTNLILQSEALDNASWSKIRASVTGNATISPDGTINADKLVEDTTATNSHIAVQGVSVTSGTVYSFSFYLKAAERVSVLASMSVSFAANSDVIFNASTGIATNIGASSASMTLVGNGWYRCVMTATANATGTGNFNFYLRSGNDIIYTGNGTSGLFIWGAQVEVGSFATSYIPTVASQVTRAADTAVIQGSNFSSWYNQNEGTMYGEFSVLSPSYTAGVALDIGAGGAFGTTEYLNWSGTGWFIAPNTAPINVSSSVATTSSAKVAGGLKLNDSIVSANGLIGVVDTSCTIPAGATTMSIGKAGWSASNYLNGTVKSINYYPTRLSNPILQTITS